MATKTTNRQRRFWGVVLFFIVSLVFICGLTALLVRSAFNNARHESKAVLAGASVDTLVELPGDRAYPGALAIGPDGNIYAGSFCTGDIWRITPDGQRETWVKGGSKTIQAASGMAFAPDGSLYVIDRKDCDPRRGQGQIKRISADGQTVEQIGTLENDEVPHSITFDNEGVLYFSDTQRGTILKLNDAGEFETWWTLPEVSDKAQPTGLAYDAVTDDIVVADTAAGTVYRLDFDLDRKPKLLGTVYGEDDRELDGLTIDDLGRVIFTIYDTNKVARIELNGDITILAEDFREPSDVGYLNGTVYVTNLDSVSLAPVISLLIDPSLPFTIDKITLPIE
ncbi:MAG: SMP-30/gluconolactonase/LRE family protein [Chloroflexi bacterium]|nr:SMP-30/gluconolactonase/LRE family protein [Chloroflexota bacterium]